MDSKNTPTVHNQAEYGEIADTVIMPGDPMRAKYIAEKFLQDFVCFNKLRGMYGYTGTYKGKKVSIMASGMGIPSMGIYSYELYKFYDVQKIIRVGSCGAYSEKLKLLDLILVDKAYSESKFGLNFQKQCKKMIESNKELMNHIDEKAKDLKINIVKGPIFTSECFDPYILNKQFISEAFEGKEILAAEMECYALFNIAEVLKRQAACILSVVDANFTDEKISPEDREKKLDKMIILALEAV